jgi:hypothetical protein
MEEPRVEHIMQIGIGFMASKTLLSAANEIHTYLGLKGWSDLDGPIGSQKGMTADEHKVFQAKVLPLIESTEYSIWKFAPELSYLAPSK